MKKDRYKISRRYQNKTTKNTSESFQTSNTFFLKTSRLKTDGSEIPLTEVDYNPAGKTQEEGQKVDNTISLKSIKLMTSKFSQFGNQNDLTKLKKPMVTSTHSKRGTKISFKKSPFEPILIDVSDYLLGVPKESPKKKKILQMKEISDKCQSPQSKLINLRTSEFLLSNSKTQKSINDEEKTISRSKTNPKLKKLPNISR